MVTTLHKYSFKYDHTEHSEETKKAILPYAKSGEYNIEHIDDVSREWRFRFIKRTFDIIVSFILLIVLFVPMVVIGVAVKVSSPGTIFYLQERLGKNGKKFKIINNWV